MQVLLITHSQSITIRGSSYYSITDSNRCKVQPKVSQSIIRCSQRRTSTQDFKLSPARAIEILTMAMTATLREAQNPKEKAATGSSSRRNTVSPKTMDSCIVRAVTQRPRAWGLEFEFLHPKPYTLNPMGGRNGTLPKPESFDLRASTLHFKPRSLNPKL